MDAMKDDEDAPQLLPLLSHIKETILSPLRLAISPTLLRTYLRTALLLLTSLLLFIAAIFAYITFYYTYIPVRGISVPVYLQFESPHPRNTLYGSAAAEGTKGAGMGLHPYGAANVQGIVGRQKYDVGVEITVPRSESNLGAGNWMVGLELRGPSSIATTSRAGILDWASGEWEVDDFSYGGHAPGREKENVSPSGSRDTERKDKPQILARSRRPAILTYRSLPTEAFYRLLRLPLYILGFGHEAETLRISMMEGVAFEKGWRNVPSSLKLELRTQGEKKLEVYKVLVRIEARLEGLRWFMWKHWIVSAVVFTGLFWGTELAVVLLSWAALSVLFGGGAQRGEQEGGKEGRLKLENTGVKKEDEEEDEEEPLTPFSETSRTFPTLSSQRPLHYTSASSSQAGKSKTKEERSTPRLEDIPPAASNRTEAEADDEDEDADFIVEEPVPGSAAAAAYGGLTDSGIGTSLESGEGREGGLLTRRKSGKRQR